MCACTSRTYVLVFRHPLNPTFTGGICTAVCITVVKVESRFALQVYCIQTLVLYLVRDQSAAHLHLSYLQQPNGGVVAVTLAGTSVELEAANTGLERVVEQKEAVHKALGVQEAHRSELTEDAASTGSTAAGLAAAAVEAEGRSKKKELDTALPGVWDLCLKYHARATTAEQSVEDLIADVARLQGEERAALSPTRENALITLGENREKVRATEEALEAAYDNFAAKSEKLGALRGELEEVRLEAAAAACGERLGRPLKADADAERLEAAKEEVAVGKGTVRVLEREVRRLEAGVRDRDTERDLDTARKEVGALKTELGSVGRKLASAEERVGSVREALGAAEARAEEAEGRLGELREAAAEMELESKRDVAAAKAQLEEMGERLRYPGSRGTVAAG